jgi:thioredoxin 1
VSSGLILSLGEDDFDEQIQHGERPILVDFWASWCQPCKVIAPSLEQLAVEMSDRIVVAKVDVDQSGELANRFGIRSIPTLAVFKGGKMVDQLIGAVPKERIRQLLEKHLAARPSE